MKVINLYGGAGAGKSTLASALFYYLRMQNQVNCELVPEFAKQVVYEGNRSNLSDQFYLLGNQHHRLWRIKQAGVEVAICDSPISLNLCYLQKYNYPLLPEMQRVVKHMTSVYTEFNVFVHRATEGNFRKNKRWSTDIDKIIWSCIRIDMEVEFSDHGTKLLCRRVKAWLDGQKISKNLSKKYSNRTANFKKEEKRKIQDCRSNS